jgi:hypothetical protein
MLPSTIAICCVILATESNVVEQANAKAALADMRRIYAEYRFAPLSELLRSRDRYAAINRLVEYMRSPDKNVRGIAWERLIIIQPDILGSSDEYEKWRKWLDELKPPPVESRSDSEGLLDLDIIRARVEERLKRTGSRRAPTKDDVQESTQLYLDVKGLIEYLRHPSWRIKTYAYEILIHCQPYNPAGWGHPEVWEEWLKQIEAGESKGSVIDY